MLRFTSCLAVLVVLVGSGQVSAAAVSLSYSEVVLADNPIGYWRLGEERGTTAFDASGNGRPGTYFGDVALGEPGSLLTDSDTSMQFTGWEMGVDVGRHSALNQLRNDFTIEGWVYSHGGRTGTSIVSTKDGASGYRLTASSLGVPVFNVNGVKDYIFSEVLPTDEWVYIALVFDASKDAHVYINGEHSQTITGSGSARTNSQSFRIGGSHFTAGLDEVAIYGRSLTGGEIREHYLAAVPEPSSLILLSIGAVGLLAYARWWRR